MLHQDNYDSDGVLIYKLPELISNPLNYCYFLDSWGGARWGRFQSTLKQKCTMIIWQQANTSNQTCLPLTSSVFKSRVVTPAKYFAFLPPEVKWGTQAPKDCKMESATWLVRCEAGCCGVKIWATKEMQLSPRKFTACLALLLLYGWNDLTRKGRKVRSACLLLDATDQRMRYH